MPWTHTKKEGRSLLRFVEWVGGGRHLEVALAGGGSGKLFYRVFGEGGSWVTLFHGFPTCSWDWAGIVDALARRHRVLVFDFLGFGDSSKPRGHDYSLLEQADLAETLWRALGIEETVLVAHDYGASAALEVLSRQSEGRLAVRATGTTLMNAGLYLDLYRPLLIQTLLRQPILGALIARLLTESTFRRNFSSIFSPAHPLADDALRQHWQAVERHGGRRIYHRLIRYIGERARYQERWEAALHDDARGKLSFIWGLADPISGASILGRIREHRPEARVLALEPVGHYPQIEVPEAVARELLETYPG